jgi:cytidine deaminase
MVWGWDQLFVGACSVTAAAPDRAALIDAATAAMRRAYAPYSKFRVGAALLADDHSVHAGCNVENASYPAGICAERTALSRAVADGCRAFVEIVIVTEAAEPTPPCGICRQALIEFAPTLDVTSVTLAGKHYTWRLDELLPSAFAASLLTVP